MSGTLARRWLSQTSQWWLLSQNRGGSSGLIDPGVLRAPLVLTRAQVAGVESTARAADGATWATFGADTPRFVGVGRRLLVGGQRTNSIRNPRAEGALAGTPGTLPTHASLSLPSGLSQQVVNVGVRDGITYIDLRIFGTPSGGSAGYRPEGAYAAVPSSNGQTWTASLFVALVGGTMTGITNLTVNHSFADNVGLIAGQTFSGPLITPTAVWQRASVTCTASNAAVVFGRMQLLLGFTVGAAIDATFRIGWPQLELGASASTPILPPVGAPDASTRGADIVTAPLSALGISGNGACTVLLSGVHYDGQNNLLSISDGSNANRLTLRTNGAGTAFVVEGRAANVALSAVTQSGNPIAVNAPWRVGLSLPGDGSARCVGVAGSTAVLSGGPTSGLTTLRVGGTEGGTTPLFGEVNTLRVLPAVLSDADLQAAVAALPA